MNVQIKKLYEDSILPTRGSEKAAAYDVYAYLNDGIQEVFIHPHATVKIGTGIAIAPPPGFFVGIYARSGLSTKQGLRPANCVGVADEDYRGEYIVALHNDTGVKRSVRHGDRIGQIILQQRFDMNFEEVDQLDTTARADGGFGSTGVN